MNAIEREALLTVCGRSWRRSVSRFEVAGPDIQGELALDVKRAPLVLDSSWLPVCENRRGGRGIFLQLNAGAVNKWLASLQ